MKIFHNEVVNVLKLFREFNEKYGEHIAKDLGINFTTPVRK